MDVELSKSLNHSTKNKSKYQSISTGTKTAFTRTAFTKTRTKTAFTKTRTLRTRTRRTTFASPHSHIGDGAFRAAILGFSDGMISNLLLILGVQFALENEDNLIVTGFSGLVASAFSMAFGEWISMKNQSEALKAEAITEENHLNEYWQQEMDHLLGIFGEHGISTDTQKLMQRDLKKAANDKVVNFHLMMELGIDQEETGNPIKAALFSFMFVAIGAACPIIPYTFLDDNTAWIFSLIFVGVVGTIIGLATGTISGTNVFVTSIRQVLGIAIVTGITFLLNYYAVSQISQ